MHLVLNEAVEAARKRRRTVPLDTTGPENASTDPEDTSRGPHEPAEERRRVWAALAKPPPAQRAVIVRRYYLGMSEAEMTGGGLTAPGTIKWRLHAARKRLARLLHPARATGREGATVPGRRRRLRP